MKCDQGVDSKSFKKNQKVKQFTKFFQTIK